MMTFSSFKTIFPDSMRNKAGVWAKCNSPLGNHTEWDFRKTHKICLIAKSRGSEKPWNPIHVSVGAKAIEASKTYAGNPGGVTERNGSVEGTPWWQMPTITSRYVFQEGKSLAGTRLEQEVIAVRNGERCFVPIGGGPQKAHHLKRMEMHWKKGLCLSVAAPNDKAGVAQNECMSHLL